MLKQVSQEEYTKAVIAAIQLAQQSTSGGRMAAQALLSAYNGEDFQLDIASLSVLDRNNFETIMTVIRGRYDTGTEPHYLVENGSQIFRDLWDHWERLHVVERGKRECPTCDGRGRVYKDDDDDEGQECSHCKGKGHVCRCQM